VTLDERDVEIDKAATISAYRSLGSIRSRFGRAMIADGRQRANISDSRERHGLPVFPAMYIVFMVRALVMVTL